MSSQDLGRRAASLRWLLGVMNAAPTPSASTPHVYSIGMVSSFASLAAWRHKCRPYAFGQYPERVFYMIIARTQNNIQLKTSSHR